MIYIPNRWYKEVEKRLDTEFVYDSEDISNLLSANIQMQVSCELRDGKHSQIIKRSELVLVKRGDVPPPDLIQLEAELAMSVKELAKRVLWSGYISTHESSTRWYGVVLKPISKEWRIECRTLKKKQEKSTTNTSTIFLRNLASRLKGQT